MKKIIVMLLAAATMLAFSSCKKIAGEGPVQTENRPVTDFSGIYSAINGKVYFRQSPSYTIEVIAQQNIIDMLETYKSGNDLVLKFKNNRTVTSGTTVIVNITAPSLESLQLSGSGELFVQGNIITESLHAEVSGSGIIIANNLQVSNKLTARVSGSGSIRVEAGVVKKDDLMLSGSGSIDLAGLRADDAIVGISGSGTIKVYAAQTLDADISGSGIVYYSGSPAVTSHVAGSGRVIHL